MTEASTNRMAERTRSKAQGVLGRLPARGCWIGLPGILAAEIVGRAGYDFGVVDMEHGPATTETLAGHLIALEAAGAAGLARVPQAEGPWIKRALDLGAAGIVAPRIETPEQAARAVAEMRYGPSGQRGVATRIVRAARYGGDADYLQSWNDRALFLAQIETPESLARAAEIAAVDGVDALFFGPADFSAAAGFPGAAAVAQAFTEMERAARAAGKLTATLPFGNLTARALLARGVDVVTVAYDVMLLRDAAVAALEACRDEPDD